jgi:hypothetical protein
MLVFKLVRSLFIIFYSVQSQYTFINDGFDEEENEKNQFGSLTGDVQNWAALLQNYILQVYIEFKLKLDITF